MKTCIAAVALASLALVGCYDLTESIRTTIEISQTLTIDLQGDCDGSGEQDGATYQKRNVGDDCVIDIQWAGAVLDLSEVRDNVDIEAPKYDINPNTARLGAMELQRVTATGYDADGIRLDLIPFPDLDATLYFGEVEAFSLARTVIGGRVWERVVDVPEEAVVVADEAFRRGVPVDGSVVATLRIPLEAMAAAQAATGPVAIEINADILVTALVTKTVF